jgi:hypothetical protein
MDLRAKREEAAEAIFATGYTDVDPELESMDPAERLEFSRPPQLGIQRFDTRSNDELKEVISDHPLLVERERAVWEYADREKSESLLLLKDVATRDLDPSLRYSTLWAIQKAGGFRGIDIISESLRDEHPEVRDWARLLLREMTGSSEHETDSREVKFDETNPFDQTLPLQIAGYARMLVPEIGWIQATISPRWFESIVGRVMACTRQDTFDTNLIIAKTLFGYHPDGTDHHEIYMFHGFTQRRSEDVNYHQYEGVSRHTFYPSGKIEDASVTPIRDVPMAVSRIAETAMSPQHLQPYRVVESVRGRYMGPAYINAGRVMANGMAIGPGEVQIASLHHPIVGKLTNTFLVGTFKGKLSDINGDGYLDVNTEACHSTIDGELDYDLDGIANEDPFDAH